MKFLFSDCIIIRYNHHHITKLDLVLTSILYKINNVADFDSIVATDHKLIEFEINLKIPKQKQLTKRILYNLQTGMASQTAELGTAAPDIIQLHNICVVQYIWCAIYIYIYCAIYILFNGNC